MQALNDGRKAAQATHNYSYGLMLKRVKVRYGMVVQFKANQHSPIRAGFFMF